jgi:hypothetical protein
VLLRAPVCPGPRLEDLAVMVLDRSSTSSSYMIGHACGERVQSASIDGPVLMFMHYG